MKNIFRVTFLVFGMSITLNHYIIAGGDPIKCPPDITINCCQDFNDTNITGHPGKINYVFNNYIYSDSVGINECRVGKIRRIWTGYNETGQFSCKQYIFMERNDIFNGNIHWPADWSGSCEDVIPYNEPVYNIGFCDQIAHTFKDDTFRFDENSCIKILRNWKVIDWCLFKPNTSPVKGLYTHTQVLMVTDKIAPKITACNDRIVKALGYDCTADALFSQSATDNNCGKASGLKWIFEMDIRDNCSLDTTITIFGQNPVVTIKKLPTGKHLVKWKVFDGCANVSTCTEKITVVDGKPPALFCYLSTTANLIQGDDSIRLPARHFVKESYDNCTSKSKIVFSFSPEKKDSFLTFDCDDTGFQFLRIYAIDEAGNSDYTFILVRIQVNEPCTSNSISGQIRDLRNNPVPDILLSLEGAGKIYNIASTDQDGSFNIPYKENYIRPNLRFSASGNIYSQIKYEDILLLKDYLLGKTDLNEIQKLAADLNNDGSISAQDLKLMRKMYEGNYSPDDISEKIRFFLVKDDGSFSEQIDYINDFRNFLNIRCVKTGEISGY
ncbi:MAG: dockerin type I domain-containing protein [Deltaproteobacteria bacterium]